jgi:hypothetical protein
LSAPIAVSRVVFDPDEGDPPEEASSEIRRSILVQTKTSHDRNITDDDRALAAEKARCLRQAYEIHERSEITVIDLSESALALFARLTSPDHVEDYVLRFPLNVGEAASLAIAVTEELVLATDDSDALTALHAIRPSHPYERIRRLLHRAAKEGRLSESEANDLHARMRELGFRDRGVPFPRSGR